MDRETARQEIRRQVSCIPYLEKSKGRQYCCPFDNCKSGHGPNGTGAVEYYPKTNTWFCHACKRGGDVIDLYKMNTGADYNTALVSLAQEAGITIDPYRPDAAADFAPQEAAGGPQSATRSAGGEMLKERPQASQEAAEPAPTADYTDYYNVCMMQLDTPAAISYLQARGISIDTAQRCNLGFDPAADPANAPGATGDEYKPHPCPRIIIPTSKAHYVGRRIDGKKEYAKMNPKREKGAGAPGIFNASALYAQDVREVFITEGAFDALSVLEAGYTAIALNSAGNFDALIKQLEQRRTAAALILCPDNDSDPRTAERVKKEFGTLAAELQRLNILHITADICAGYKDANEALIGNPTAFKKALIAAERAALKEAQKGTKPDSVDFYIRHLMGNDIARFKKDIKTGFNNLDREAGGLYPGLYILAAISSLGKTSFALQLADQIAAAGTDVLFFSLEQSRLELVTKSIARHMAKKDMQTAVTSLAIRKGYFPQRVTDAIQEYSQEVGNRLSIIEGNFNFTVSYIGDYIKGFMDANKTAETGERPVVIVDYLQVIQPATEKKLTTKETVDLTVTELKRISRDLDITVILISSVNRANYLSPIDFESLKESGGIEFTADVVWGLQLQCLDDPIFEQEKKIKQKRELVRKAKAATPRKIELICLKNRFGISSYCCGFNYFPAADLFTEDTGREFADDLFSQATNAPRRI